MTIVVVSLIVGDGDALARCFGHPVEPGYRGRGTAWLGIIAAVPCSPYLVKGSWYEIGLFVLLWASLPFAILGFRQDKRDEAKRAVRRERDRQRRADRRAAKLTRENSKEERRADRRAAKLTRENSKEG